MLVEGRGENLDSLSRRLTLKTRRVVVRGRDQVEGGVYGKNLSLP